MARGLLTYHIVFVIYLASRRVQIVGSTRHPNGLFMRQVSRTLTASDGLLSAHLMLICDRDHKWSGDVRQMLEKQGVLCGADAVPGAQCQRLCRALRSLDQTGTP
jgi:hypothetical protein